jgi:uncharacterized membrane protein
MLHHEWPMYLRVLLTIHIACGMTAFVCAPVALATVKGGKTHRAWGKVYFWAMSGVAVTAMVISVMLPILFLALVAVFSFYAAFKAYRVLAQKDMAKVNRVRWYDWAAAIFTGLASLALALLGAFRPSLLNGMGVVPVVFGIIGMRLAYSSIAIFRKPPTEKMWWFYAHMQGMIASYIAACTAFSAVNLGHWFGDAWWVWLWPTIVGVPAIAWWTAKYKKKFAPKAAASAV